MRVQYEGPYDEIRVAALDHRVVPSGEAIEVPAALGRQLVAQGWTSTSTSDRPSISDVLDEVGDDPALAAEALAIEQAIDKPRKSLIAQLTKLADTDPTEVTP